MLVLHSFYLQFRYALIITMYIYLDCRCICAWPTIIDCRYFC